MLLADAVESAARSLSELTPTRIETIVHNMAMKRLQDGQFDECDLTLRELSKIEASLSKSLAAHHHGRVAYPKSPEEPVELTPAPMAAAAASIKNQNANSSNNQNHKLDSHTLHSSRKNNKDARQ